MFIYIALLKCIIICCICCIQRPFASGFMFEPTRPLGIHHLFASTPEEKEIVFLDFPNQIYSTEFLHLYANAPNNAHPTLQTNTETEREREKERKRQREERDKDRLSY